MITLLQYKSPSTASWYKKFKNNNEPTYWKDGMILEAGRTYCIAKC